MLDKELAVCGKASLLALLAVALRCLTHLRRRHDKVLLSSSSLGDAEYLRLSLSLVLLRVIRSLAESILKHGD